MFQSIFSAATSAMRKMGVSLTVSNLISSFIGNPAVQFILIGIGVGIIQALAFVIPPVPWLPGAVDADSFIKALWQVHASILGVTVVVVTIIITVIANEKDRSRTWKLYADKTRFVPLIWFNLLAITSEGLASLQTGHVAGPILFSDRIGNLILSEGFLFLLSIVAAATLFTVTVRFLDDDYVEDLAEKRITGAMPDAVEGDIRHIQELTSRLQGKIDEH